MNSLHPYWLVILAFILGLVPILIGIATSYLKVNIVLGFLKSGLGTQQAPGAVVVMALSISLSLFIMSPVIEETAKIGATLPMERLLKAPTMAALAELSPILQPWRSFLARHLGERELNYIVSEVVKLKDGEVLPSLPAHGAEIQAEGGGTGDPTSSMAFDRAHLPLKVLLPTFVLSELKEAFSMGFVLLLPFLVIDLIVANILVGLGMSMVSPPLISLPLKIALFVAADGWLLLSKGLIQSFGGV